MSSDCQRQALVESKLAKDLLEVLLVVEDVILNDKIYLIINNIDNLTKNECEEYFREIECEEYVKILNTGRPKLERNDLNETVLEAFKNNGWIEDYYSEGKIFKFKRKKDQQ